MGPVRSDEQLADLVRELVRLPRETAWVEFKENNEKPDEIGEYISALSNSAALEGQERGYLLWGVRDGDHAIVRTLASERMILEQSPGKWNITNLGAVLFAKHLADFPSLERKATRVIQYRGTNRIQTVKEQLGTRGYANGFRGLIEYINNLLP